MAKNRHVDVIRYWRCRREHVTRHRDEFRHQAGRFLMLRRLINQAPFATI
jgi:hypothetical protein